MSTIAIYDSRQIGSVQSRDGRTFTLVIGLNHGIIKQLKARSLDMNDTELQNNTSDFKRFGEGSYEEWYAKDRIAYSLISSTGELAALAWFGPKPLGRKSLRFLSEEELSKENEQKKGEWHTIVYRSYIPFRGIGIMMPFMCFAIDDYKRRFPEAKLWAGISTDNAASLALATKLGFKQVPEYVDADAHWCAMIEA